MSSHNYINTVMSVFGNKGKKKESSKGQNDTIKGINTSEVNSLHDLSILEIKLNKRFDILENYVKEILTQVNILQEENIKLTPKTTQEQQVTETIETSESPTIDKKDIIDDEAPKVVEFDIPTKENVYLPSPFEYNKFSVEDASKTRTKDSLYRIILDDSSDQVGKIEILEDADFIQAINSPKQFLENACDYDNSYSNTAKRIENAEENNGKVKREGNDWVVTQRILIKFI